MGDEAAIWTWQVIRLGKPPSLPFRILEEGPVPMEQATRDFARDLLQDRCGGPSYRVRAGVRLRPEGVRLVKPDGSEAMTYSVIDLRREGGRTLPRKDRTNP